MDQNNQLIVTGLEEGMLDVSEGNINFLLSLSDKSETIGMSFKISTSLLTTEVGSHLQVLENGSFALDELKGVGFGIVNLVLFFVDFVLDFLLKILYLLDNFCHVFNISGSEGKFLDEADVLTLQVREGDVGAGKSGWDVEVDTKGSEFLGFIILLNNIFNEIDVEGNHLAVDRKYD